MEQRFSNNSLDLETLREFCEREGEVVTYYKGDQLEREGDPARWKPSPPPSSSTMTGTMMTYKRICHSITRINETICLTDTG